MFRHIRQELKIESIQAHLGFLVALESRHRIWVDGTNDAEIERVHLEIIELIQQTRTKYAILLEKYNEA